MRGLIAIAIALATSGCIDDANEAVCEKSPRLVSLEDQFATDEDFPLIALETCKASGPLGKDAKCSGAMTFAFQVMPEDSRYMFAGFNSTAVRKCLKSGLEPHTDAIGDCISDHRMALVESWAIETNRLNDCRLAAGKSSG